MTSQAAGNAIAPRRHVRRRAVGYLVLTWWIALAGSTALAGSILEQTWPDWWRAVLAAGVWGLNALVIYYWIGGPFHVTRIPFLSALFALLMTVFGSGSYWATTQLYPTYRVSIELAAFFVAVCTLVSLLSAGLLIRIANHSQARARSVTLAWRWETVRPVTILLFGIAALGTVVSIQRIGYIPLLRGDPSSLRVEFPAIAGVWFRLSMLGGVVAVLLAQQISARKGSWRLIVPWAASLGMVSVYGPRFFFALPAGVSLLLWDRIRSRLSLRFLSATLVLGLVVLTALYFWRQQDERAFILGPIGLLLYATLSEFRDLAWALDHYSTPGRLLHGATFPSFVVPVLPAPVWNLLGVDKEAILARNSAAILANEMGTDSGQRIGAFGELFMNFGWVGAMAGAVIFGLALGYLDHKSRSLDRDSLGHSLVTLVAAVTIFAQIGQLNMYASAITWLGYPIGLLAILAARRVRVVEG